MKKGCSFFGISYTKIEACEKCELANPGLHSRCFLENLAMFGKDKFITAYQCNDCGCKAILLDDFGGCFECHSQDITILEGEEALKIISNS